MPLMGKNTHYGKYTRSELNTVFQRINGTLAKWSMCKYKKLRYKKVCAARHMREIAKKQKYLFAHWQAGITDVLI